MQSRIAPLLPFARAPDVQDLLELMNSNWYGARSMSPAMDLASSPAANAGALPPPQPRLPPLRTEQLTSARNAMLYEAGPREESGFLEDGQGTWGERQQVFARVAQEDRDGEGAEQPLPSPTQPPHRIAYASSLLADTPEAKSADVAPTIDHLQHLQAQQGPASEEADINAAWRWRFSRKWQQEQLRQLEAAPSAGGADDDDWATALDYMATAAGGMALQFGRTSSIDPAGSLEPSLSQCMSLLLDSSMSKDATGLSATPGMSTLGDGGDTPMATRRIAKAARKAEELMAHQVEIERQVAERWESAETQHPWAALSIPAVNIDSWGAFPFVLARVVDTATGRQKLLIRGRNRFTVKQAGEALDGEVTAEALNRRLPVPKVDLLGSGRIEWSRERDRCLIITGCAVHSALDTRLKRKEDVGRVAGALARTGLPPMHTVIVTDGQQPSGTAAKNS